MPDFGHDLPVRLPLAQRNDLGVNRSCACRKLYATPQGEGKIDTQILEGGNPEPQVHVPGAVFRALPPRVVEAEEVQRGARPQVPVGDQPYGAGGEDGGGHSMAVHGNRVPVSVRVEAIPGVVMIGFDANPTLAGSFHPLPVDEPGRQRDHDGQPHTPEPFATVPRFMSSCRTHTNPSRVFS